MNFPTTLRSQWATMSVREQRLLQTALIILLSSALWWLGLAPALATLRSAEKQHRVLDAQWQQMQTLQAQAKTIQTQTPLTIPQAQRLLEDSVKPLGTTAQLGAMGERVTVTFKGISADALAQWLAQARLNARATPSEAHLNRTDTGTWDGTLVMSRP
jgi:general secretion pathway protein M